MYNKGLHLVPYYCLKGLLLWGREVLMYRNQTLSIPPCLLLVFRQNIRISDCQVGNNTGFCSTPSSVMPTPLVMWGAPLWAWAHSFSQEATICALWPLTHSLNESLPYTTYASSPILEGSYHLPFHPPVPFSPDSQSWAASDRASFLILCFVILRDEPKILLAFFCLFLVA